MSTLPPDLRQLLDVAWVGSNMAAIFYGSYIIIAMCNIYYLSQKKGYKALLAYTTFMLAVTTVYIGVAINAAQTQLIDAPTNPDALGLAPQIVVDAAFVINTWMADVYLLYRCWIIWMGYPLIMVFPLILFLGSMGTSIAFLWSSAHPGAAYGDRDVQVFGIPYWTLSLSLNIIVTILIGTRLYTYRRNVREALGAHHGRHYTTIFAISVESALLYAVFALVALVLFALNNMGENVTFPMLGLIQVIAPNLIIYRVARGISFTAQDSRSATGTSVQFAGTQRTDTTVAVNSLGSKNKDMGLSTFRHTRSTLVQKDDFSSKTDDSDLQFAV